MSPSTPLQGSTSQPMCCAGSSSSSRLLPYRPQAVSFRSLGSSRIYPTTPIARRRLGAAGCRALHSSTRTAAARNTALVGQTLALQGQATASKSSSCRSGRSDSHVAGAQRRRLFGVSCADHTAECGVYSTPTVGACTQQHHPLPSMLVVLADNRPTAAPRQHCQARHLCPTAKPLVLGWHVQEGANTPDGSTSGSSSDEDAPPTQLPPAQQRAAAEAERLRKRQDALRRIEASTAQLRRKKGTGSAIIDAALQKMLAMVSVVACTSVFFCLRQSRQAAEQAVAAL